MSLQWKDRQGWTEVEWHRKMSDNGLEQHANKLLDRAQHFGEQQEWERYNDCRNALFIVRSEQQRRRKHG